MVDERIEHTILVILKQQYQQEKGDVIEGVHEIIIDIHRAADGVR